jgi:hypothetical protein
VRAALPDFNHHNDTGNEKEHPVNETTSYYGDDEARSWAGLGEMWNRMERDMRTEALKASLNEAVALWGMMIDASADVAEAAQDAGFSDGAAEEIALGFVLKLTAGATTSA